MRMTGKWVFVAVMVALQLLVAGHGIAHARSRHNAPVRVAAGWLAAREGSDGAWHLVDVRNGLQAGDRLQINVHTGSATQLFVFHLQADGDVRRLHPPPGDASQAVAADAYFALPSPTTWYSVDRVESGDRLVLVATGESELTGDFHDLRSRRPAATSSGKGEILDVPLPDGGSEQVRLMEKHGAGTVWMEWEL